MRRSFYILLFTLSCQVSLACGPFDRLYSPEQYYTFRICGNNMNGLNNTQNDLQPQAQIAIEKNCQYWSEITSTDIPITDIKEVVYDWNYEQLSRLHACACDSGHLQGNNAFAKWLVKHNDTEVTSYLLLAKRCEIVRSQQNSEWYYPVEGDNESITLSELCTQAKRYHSQRLLDRYTLQMMRCFISMRQYSDCLNLWIDKKHVFRQNIIFSMAKGYAAGAFYHVGEKEIAKRMFIEVGDIFSYLFCQQMEGKPYSNLNLLSLLCNNNIDDNRILPLMQYIVHTNEGHKESYDYSALNELALKSLPKVSSKNKAAWHYLASYTYDKQGNSHAALKHIKQASRYATNQDLKDAIRVLRIYLTIKCAPKYDNSLENYLYNELSWLHGKIVSKLDSTVIVEASMQRDGHSQYYWNDMMRKIIISQVVPKCLSSGYKVRALQFLNYADNCIWKTRGSNANWKVSSFCHENEYDYRTDFFINLDSIGVKYVKRLAYRMKHPLCGLDLFLLRYSYNDMDYLNDIIGTQLIAGMRYKEAVRYLALVSDKFIQTRNIYRASEYDAFSADSHMNKKGKSYKLDFAKKMYALEKRIKAARNPNDKAELMLEYTRGLQNSIGRCWRLTSYYNGEWLCYPFYSMYQRYLHDNIAKRSCKIMDSAFKLFTDEERAAEALYKWNRYKTAATKYPKTKMAQYIRGHCDELIDYQSIEYR